MIFLSWKSKKTVQHIESSRSCSRTPTEQPQQPGAGWYLPLTKSKHIMLANGVTATMATALFNQITCTSKLRWAEKRGGEGGVKSGKAASALALGKVTALFMRESQEPLPRTNSILQLTLRSLGSMEALQYHLRQWKIGFLWH